MTRRQVVTGSCILIAAALLYYAVCQVLPADSLALLIVSDVGFVLVEIAALVLCVIAYLWSKGSSHRWVWIWVASWLALNVFADSAWAYYEVVLRVEVPSPGIPDVGYLSSYLVTFVAVIVLAREYSGTLRALETLLDATMFTVGAAALGWPLVLGPLLDTAGTGVEYWITLAYPVGDLLIVLAFVSFFFAVAGAGRQRPPGYLIVICVAFGSQIIADGAYFVMAAQGREYGPGSWLDLVWLLSFTFAGAGALMGMRAGRERSRAGAADAGRAEVDRSRLALKSSHARILIPYVALPIIAGMMAVQLQANGWSWDRDAQVLAYLGFALVALLVCRQYVVLMQNRRLNTSLSLISSELEDRVGDLADINERLEALSDQSHRLNSLREVRAVAENGLDLACRFANCPGGWISLKDNGVETVTVTRGQVSLYRPGDAKFNAVQVAKGVLRAVPLQVRGETLGTMWLVRAGLEPQGPDMLRVIAAHAATAIENTRSYEEALHLAERDPLTSLYNHRGIHKRLAGESLRAQQNGYELSLIMMDMDDFKLLNDTYGHPAGDAVLRHVSEAIRAVLRHSDLAGRVGGDEILVVLPSTGTEGALQFSERLLETLHSSPCVTEQGMSIPVRVSLGVATFPGDAQSPAQLVEIADANLYAAKQQGGDTVTSTPRSEGELPDAHGILGVAGKLLAVVGARDHYTRRHSEQVTLYALSLGESLGLSEESLNTLHVAAMLHDVGKIGVSGHLLRRPSTLTAAEQDMVRRHVDMSATVINDMPRLARVAEAVQAHHEHHDGGGYPGEVAGDDIPLLGRILAVADAYSAMTLDRPYRKSLTREQARAELLRAAGTQFDPQLVRRFLQVIDAQEAEPAVARVEAG